MKPVAIFRHNAGEGPGYFATFLERHAIPWQLFRIDANDAIPAAPNDYSGLVFMGGPMSVNDSLPWIANELTLIRQAVAQNIPVLGHCLGGQLMAKALGATVSRNPQKEIGWGSVQVLENATATAWFGEFKEFMSFHWHGETFGLPAGATRILESPYCTHQAFSLGPHLGMQCHVEMTETMIATWCKNGAEEIAASPATSVQQPAEILATTPQHLQALHTVADRIYNHWIAGLSR